MTTSERSRRDSSARDQISPNAQRKASVPTSPSARSMLARSVAGSAAARPPVSVRRTSAARVSRSASERRSAGRRPSMRSTPSALRKAASIRRKAAMAAGNPA